MTGNDQYYTIIKLVEAAETDNFVDLVQLAKLDPRSDFRGANLEGLDFSNLDLSALVSREPIFMDVVSGRKNWACHPHERPRR